MEKSPSITETIISDKIHTFRGHRVLLDFDLAELYQVDTKHLKRQVRRNIERFPEDFMFELTPEEYSSLRSQFGTLKRGEHIKYLPMAFTEQGVAMLSSVLNSKSAIDVNIQIMRIFTKIRHLLIDQAEIRLESKRSKTRLISTIRISSKCLITSTSFFNQRIILNPESISATNPTIIKQIFKISLYPTSVYSFILSN